jgi:hypothetical protein
MRQCALAVLSAIWFSVAASAVPTVTFSLASSRAGTVVPPGSLVDWNISFVVSSGDNQGAALACIDFVQSAGNPAALDLPVASGVPTGMTNFSRPAGICNPGEGGNPTGYIGSQRGTAGARNLVQIGGAQNTFGQAFAAGAGVGESANVIAGVGQVGSQALASGSFAAPSACGNYTFSITNAIANVLVARNNPPAISPVTQATATLSAGSFSVTVARPGDLDLDSDVDLDDLATLLANFGTTGGADWSHGDVTGDSNVDLDDLSLLLSNYGTTCA